MSAAGRYQRQRDVLEFSIPMRGNELLLNAVMVHARMEVFNPHEG